MLALSRANKVSITGDGSTKTTKVNLRLAPILARAFVH